MGIRVYMRSLESSIEGASPHFTNINDWLSIGGVVYPFKEWSLLVPEKRGVILKLVSLVGEVTV